MVEKTFPYKADKKFPKCVLIYTDYLHIKDQIINDLPIKKREIFLDVMDKKKSFVEIKKEKNISTSRIRQQFYSACRIINNFIEKKKAQEKYLPQDLPIEFTDLSPRVKNVLMANEIKFIRDLESFSLDEISTFKLLNKKGIGEIIDYLKNIGLQLRYITTKKDILKFNKKIRKKIQGKWTSVKECMPNPKQFKEVLTFEKLLDVRTFREIFNISIERSDELHKDKDGVWSDTGAENITHWMPLPDAPENKEIKKSGDC